MNALMLLATILFPTLSHADEYMKLGEHRIIGRTIVWCGVNETPDTAKISASCNSWHMTVSLINKAGDQTQLRLETTSPSLCNKFAGQINASSEITKAKTFAVCDSWHLHSFSATQTGELKDLGITDVTSPSECEKNADSLNK